VNYSKLIIRLTVIVLQCFCFEEQRLNPHEEVSCIWSTIHSVVYVIIQMGTLVIILLQIFCHVCL